MCLPLVEGIFLTSVSTCPLNESGLSESGPSHAYKLDVILFLVHLTVVLVLISTDHLITQDWKQIFNELPVHNKLNNLSELDINTI